MDNDLQAKFSTKTIVFVAIQFVFIVIMIVAFSKVFESDTAEVGLSVNNINLEIEDLPENGKRVIASKIYNAVTNNSTNMVMEDGGVIIREGSLIKRYYEKFDLTYVNFIADIPWANQSYQVFYEWSENPINDYIEPNDSAAVMCVDKDVLIYGDFDCVTDDDNMRQMEVNNMLIRYGYTLPEASVESLYAGPTDEMNIMDKTRLMYMSCDTQCVCRSVSESEKQLAISELDKFTKSLGFKLEDIDYHFDNCTD